MTKDNTWEDRDPETGKHHRHGHLLELRETDWLCLICRHHFDAAIDAELFWCGEPCVHPTVLGIH